MSEQQDIEKAAHGVDWNNLNWQGLTTHSAVTGMLAGMGAKQSGTSPLAAGLIGLFTALGTAKAYSKPPTKVLTSKVKRDTLKK